MILISNFNKHNTETLEPASNDSKKPSNYELILRAIDGNWLFAIHA